MMYNINGMLVDNYLPLMWFLLLHAGYCIVQQQYLGTFHVSTDIRVFHHGANSIHSMLK